jgi:uncharacterized protein (DUF433 family)
MIERACEGKALVAEALARITIDPEVCGGRPCIRGLRIRVTDILDMLAGGATRQEILGDYPYLEDEDITAALDYASRAVDHPVIAAAE